MDAGRHIGKRADRIVKIAIIGASGYRTETEDRKIVSFPWDKLAGIKNLADYDTIILNLLSVNPMAIDSVAFSSALNLQTMKDVLMNEGKFIVVGDPRFMVPSNPTDKAGGSERPFLYWAGMKFHWDGHPGDTVEFHGFIGHPLIRSSRRDFSRYESYVKQLKTWKYSLRGVEPDFDALGEVLDLPLIKEREQEIEVALFGFATNRYDCNLAFSANILLCRTVRTYSSTSTERVIEFSPIVFLPATTLTEDEALRLILRDVCQVSLEQPAPEWVEQMTAPGQEQVDKDIEAIRSEVTSLIDQWKAAEDRRADIRRPLRLLYDGGDSLEEAVRDMFRRLGAQVEDPADPGKEDGWLTVEIDGKPAEAVLEVKGTEKSQFPEAGLRQLMEWKNRGMQLRQKKYKGIFIGNNAWEVPLDQRPKRPFSNQWIKTAELAEVAAILSSDLYKAYALYQLGQLDTSEFWRRLFATNGVFDGKWMGEI